MRKYLTRFFRFQKKLGARGGTLDGRKGHKDCFGAISRSSRDLWNAARGGSGRPLSSGEDSSRNPDARKLPTETILVGVAVVKHQRCTVTPVRTADRLGEGEGAALDIASGFGALPLFGDQV